MSLICVISDNLLMTFVINWRITVIYVVAFLDLGNTCSGMYDNVRINYNINNIINEFQRTFWD